MGWQRSFSRRHILAMSAAAGGLAVGRSFSDAAAQAAKRIERLDPALDQIISTAEPIVDLATNLGGAANVEGPLWWKEGGYLLFRGTDLKRWKYAPGQGISVFKENTNAANGITRDVQGRLVACEAATRRVVREEHARRQHHRAGEQLSGPPPQLSKRYRGEIRWRDLFHRSLGRPSRAGAARANRPHLCGGVSHFARQRNAHAFGQ